MDSMTLKDWLTLAVATLAFLLGCYNLYRTVKLERRTELKPYFAAAWKMIEPALKIHFMATRENCAEADRHAAAGPDHQEFIRLIDGQVAIPQLDEHVRQYDSGFGRAVDHYRQCAQDFRRAVNEFNRFVDPTTMSFVILGIAQASGNPIGQRDDETAEEKAEREGADLQRIGDARQIIRRFLPNVEKASPQMLGQNEMYRQEIQHQRGIVGSASQTLRKAMAALDKRMKVYAIVFREETGQS